MINPLSTKPRFDYTSVGFYTFDCLCRPVHNIPPFGDTYFVDEFTLAVSGAAGSAAIVAAKHGMNVQAVGGVGQDDMGTWVLDKIAGFGVDTTHMQICPGLTTSSSIVTTRANGLRPALHKRGATAGFYVLDTALDSVLDTHILHIGGVGLMDKMDQNGRSLLLLQQAKKRGCITTLDVFAAKRQDMDLVNPLLPYTDFFMPSEEEALALSDIDDMNDRAAFFLDAGAGAVVLTCGERGVVYRDRTGQCFDLPAFDIQVVCTCGCGDCFNAGFATGLFLQKPMRECLMLGQAAAAQNATGLGSQAGVTTLDATLEFARNTPLRAISAL